MNLIITAVILLGVALLAWFGIRVAMVNHERKTRIARHENAVELVKEAAARALAASRAPAHNWTRQFLVIACPRCHAQGSVPAELICGPDGSSTVSRKKVCSLCKGMKTVTVPRRTPVE